MNIHDVLNAKRTGEPVVPFDDFETFRDYTLDGNVYPALEAHKDTFLPVFLKELNP